MKLLICSGMIDVLNLRPEDIKIEDIAHALSLTCRYNGHVKTFYSVAEHCVRMSMMFEARDLALAALLHDAPEAYIGDVIRPLRALPQFAYFNEVDFALTAKIFHHFGLDPEIPKEVRDMDDRMIPTEIRDLFTCEHDFTFDCKPFPSKISPWYSKRAEQKFLDRFAKLNSVKMPW